LVLNDLGGFDGAESPTPRLSQILHEFRRKLNKYFTDPLHRFLVSRVARQTRKLSEFFDSWNPIAANSPALQRFQSLPEQPEQFFRGPPVFELPTFLAGAYAM
jgi:hypothetical protein